MRALLPLRLFGLNPGGIGGSGYTPGFGPGSGRSHRCLFVPVGQPARTLQESILRDDGSPSWPPCLSFLAWAAGLSRPGGEQARCFALLTGPPCPCSPKYPGGFAPNSATMNIPVCVGGGRSRTPYWFGSSPPPYQTLRSTYKVRVRAALPDFRAEAPWARSSGSSRWSQPDLRRGSATERGCRFPARPLVQPFVDHPGGGRVGADCPGSGSTANQSPIKKGLNRID